MVCNRVTSSVGIFTVLTLHLLSADCKIVTRIQQLVHGGHNIPSSISISASQSFEEESGRAGKPRVSTPPFTLSDGEQIALEVTNQLLPPTDLAETINAELKLIKYKYRVVRNIVHQKKWEPGQLLSTTITEEQIRQLNTSSEYGPLVDVTTVDLRPFYIVTALTFSKPYNPIVLGDKLKFQYGFGSSPNTVYFDGNDIFYDASTLTYVFKQRGCLGSTPTKNDDCNRDEDTKHYWEFLVTDGGNVRLVKEYDIDADGNKSYNRRYFVDRNRNRVE